MCIRDSDLRESPVLGLIRDLWQDGIDVLVHDPDVQPDKMLGSNREYLQRHLPQIDEILCHNIADALNGCEAVIVAQKRPEFTAVLQELNGQVAVLDLVRISEHPSLLGLSNYRGICW